MRTARLMSCAGQRRWPRPQLPDDGGFAQQFLEEVLRRRAEDPEE